MPTVDVDLRVTSKGDGATYLVTAWLTLPESFGAARSASYVPVLLDWDALLWPDLDPDQYGRRLSALLFADQQILDLWREARRIALDQQIALRVRLHLGLAANLHRLVWETLRDPISDQPLADDPQVLLSRCLDAPERSRTSLPEPTTLSALLAIASPSNLHDDGFSPVAAADEAARAQVAMGDIPTTILARALDGQPVTLERLIRGLRSGAAILYLVAHARIVQDQPCLWLEQDDGTSQPVAAIQLAQLIADLPDRPQLILLAAGAAPAHSQDDPALAAAGLLLAAAGLDAVIAMQGPLRTASMARLVASLFRELRRHGQIDQALALARADLRGSPDYWRPALFMRAADGALWRAAAPGASLCPICRGALQPGEIFCSSCGAQLSGTISKSISDLLGLDDPSVRSAPPATSGPETPSVLAVPPMTSVDIRSLPGADLLEALGPDVARQQEIVDRFEQIRAIFGAATPQAVIANLAEARASLAQILLNAVPRTPEAQQSAAPEAQPSPAAATIRQRRLDAAMPGLIGLGQKVSLRVQVRLPEQPQISAADWPAKTRPASVDQQSTLLRVAFSADPASGEAQNVILHVRVVAEAFLIDQDEDVIELPPDGPSPMLRFDMVAQILGNTEVTVQVRSPEGRLLGATFIGAEISPSTPEDAPLRLAQITLNSTVVSALPTLEISLDEAADRLDASLTLIHPDGRTPSELASAVPVQLDQTQLLAKTLDPRAYGQTLAAQLFADQQLCAAWREACAFADGAGSSLRVRLRLGADHLHQIYWETLSDPERNAPIALGGRMLFSRYLPSADTRAVALPHDQAIRAALVVANPTDLGRYSLAPIKVEQEVALVMEAFAHLPVAIYADHAEARGRATLQNIEAELNHGAHVLYLICHGALVADQPYLWLEREDGTSDRINAATFVEMIQQLAVPPVLVILASCASAGDGQQRALIALGPRLAQAGVPAVIGFQGAVAVDTARHMLAPLIAELRAADGVIDRAIGLARSGLRQGAWWQAVLWLRVGDGRLWAPT